MRGGPRRNPWAGLAFAGATVAALDDRSMLDGVPDGLGWVVPAMVGVIVVGGLLVTDFDRRAGGWGPVLLAVTMFGVWVTVPETQHVVVLMGAVLPIGLLGWPKPLASLGIPGAVVATGVVAWGVAVDGQGRPGAVVGGFACLGIMVVEPVVRRVIRRRATDPLVVVAAHVVLVAWCSRVAGLQDSAGVALVLVAVGYVAAGVFLARIRTGAAHPQA